MKPKLKDNKITFRILFCKHREETIFNSELVYERVPNIRKII